MSFPSSTTSNSFNQRDTFAILHTTAPFPAGSSIAILNNTAAAIAAITIVDFVPDFLGREGRERKPNPPPPNLQSLLQKANPVTSFFAEHNQHNHIACTQLQRSSGSVRVQLGSLISRSAARCKAFAIAIAIGLNFQLLLEALQLRESELASACAYLKILEAPPKYPGNTLEELVVPGKLGFEHIKIA
ncbi:hypothetical protein WAI453_003143 [Rhynchosporium graminicola]